MVRRASRSNSIGRIRLGKPSGVVRVEGRKRSAARVAEMMIPQRMDWRELHAIVCGRRIERDPLSLVLVSERGRRVRRVRPLVIQPCGEGGGIRVCGGGHWD